MRVHRLSLSPAIISLCLRSPDTFLFLPFLAAYRKKSRGIKEASPPHPHPPRRVTAKVTMDIGERGPVRSIWSEEWKFQHDSTAERLFKPAPLF